MTQLESPQIDELATALVAFQHAMPPVEKNATNPYFSSKYASFDTIVAAAKPILEAVGLAVTQLESHIILGERVFPMLRTRLLHSSGQFIEDSAPLLLSKQDAQGQGSATTYLKRYSYCSILGIVADSDDDGNAGSVSSQTDQAPQRRAQPTPAPALKERAAASAGRPAPPRPAAQGAAGP